MASSNAPAPAGGVGNKLQKTDSEDSLWDVNFEMADQRISARRQRIKNRISAAKKIRKMIQVKHLFGYHSTDNRETFPVEAQCDASRALIDNVVDNGTELVTNVRLAADHLQVQHRSRNETRNTTLRDLISKEDKETNELVTNINKAWPGPEVKQNAPLELYEQIMAQKKACNDLLQKRNDLIAVLESEIKDSDNQYKTLIEEYHENTSVLASRMEAQIQALEGLVDSERDNLTSAYTTQKSDHLKRNDRQWQVKLEAINRTASDQMEERLKTLKDQEEELDELFVADSEAYVDMKHKMEENIAALSDQIQLLDAVHQMNEERLDYEIHVLRKHEEEIVLVKSEQKRKITVLHDSINKLRRKVRLTNSQIAKEEAALHENIASIREQLEKLFKKKKAYSVYTSKKKADIAAMVRDEIQKDIEKMVDTDFRLQALYMTKKPKRLEVFTEETLKELASLQEAAPSGAGGTTTAARGGTSVGTVRSKIFSMGTGISKVGSESEDQQEGSGDGGESAEEFAANDEALKEMLSALIQEANFLVEDNLALLVEDECTEDERNLFKLDSILTAIGLQGEEAVFRVLREHEKNPSKAFDSILKVIRTQVEVKKRDKEQALPSAGSQSVSYDKSSSRMVGPAGTSSLMRTDDGKSTLSTGINEWSLVESKLNKFKSDERLRLLTALKNYNESLTERASLLDRNQRMGRHNAELRMLLNLD